MKNTTTPVTREQQTSPTDQELLKRLQRKWARRDRWHEIPGMQRIGQLAVSIQMALNDIADLEEIGAERGGQVNPYGDEDDIGWEELVYELRGWSYTLNIAARNLFGDFTPVVRAALAEADLLDVDEDEDAEDEEEGEHESAVGVLAAPITPADKPIVAAELPPAKARPYWIA